MIHRNDTAASSSRAPVLLAEDLHKSYGPRQALQGLSFSLHAGHILGFLGPNGAGKTTAIRILTTMLAPTRGHFVVDGVSSSHPEQIRRKIGVLPENLGLPKNETGIEYLTFFGQLYGQPATQARADGAALLEEMGLAQRARTLIGTYSHGMRQRLGIARALINDPNVVFLDEPTLGLDPRGQQELLLLVRRIARERGAGVVLCSHLLSEIEGVCDDVVILNAGQVVGAGPVADVVGQTQREVLQQNILRVQVPPTSIDQARQVLEAIPYVLEISQTGETTGWLRVEIMSVDETANQEHHINNRILAALIRAKVPVLSFGSEGSRLQDAFFHLTEETIR